MRSSIFARFIALYLLMSGIFVFGAGKSHAAYNLIMYSSVTTNTGYYSDCKAVVSDASGNIFASGVTNENFFTIKYDNNFNFISSRTYNGDGDSWDMANALAVDNSGNVFAAGNISSGGTSDLYIAKYNNQLSQVLASSQYDSGAYDVAYGMALDNSGNVFVAAVSNNNYLTIKYNSNLEVISSVTYNSGASEARRLAVDNNGNIFVTGYRDDGGTQGIFTLKYDNDLNYQTSAGYNTAGEDSGDGIAVDASGNVFVTGRQGDDEYITIKYDNNLVVVSSTVKVSPTAIDGTDPADIKVDSSGNVYVALGFSSNAMPYFRMVKYDNNLNELSNFGHSLERAGYPAAVALDPWGNAYLGGYKKQEDPSSDYDFHIMKFLAPATVASVAPNSGFTTGGTNLTIMGTGFVSGATVSIGGTVATEIGVISSTTINAKTPSSLTNGAKNVVVTNADTNSVTLAGGFTYEYPAPTLTSITPSSGTASGGTTIALTGTGFVSGAAVTIGGAAATNIIWVGAEALSVTTGVSISTGAKNVVVTNPDGKSAELASAFTYFTEPAVVIVNSSGTVITPASGGTTTIRPETGEIGVSIPPGTFNTNVTLSITTATAPSSSQSTIKVTSVCMEITNSAGLQPSKEITLTVFYRDSDITGLEESKLTLARYDNGRWIAIPTIVYASQNKLVGTVKHLSTFAVVQLAPAADLAGVKAYPMPFRPADGPLTIDNLTAEANIKIFTIAGELIRNVGYVSANGKATWDGKNDGGSTVASGVYIMFVKSDNGTKKLKIAVEK